MINRRRGAANKTSFLAMGEKGTSEYVLASRRGKPWKPWEDQIIIAAGSSESSELDAQLASQLGRTPSAVRGRRARLNKMGKL